MGKPAFLSLNPGAIFELAGRRVRVTCKLDASSMLVQYLDDGKSLRLHVDDIMLAAVSEDESPISAAPFDDFSSDEWEIAQARYQIIQPLLETVEPSRARTEEVAKAANVHPATLYRWIKDFQESGHVSVLIPRARGRRKGSKLLDAKLEAIIDDVIDKDYLDPKKRATAQAVCNKVKELCIDAKLPPPHPNSIRNRIHLIPQRTVYERRGYKDIARYQFGPIKGRFPGAAVALAVVQIDHTPANVVVVHEQTRLPMGRPWVTLAIDVNTRMVVGIYISMDHPSATAVGMCISRGMLPKGSYLKELDISGGWPIWGKMKTIHCDNAKEFRGKMLKEACKEYTMNLELRPVKKPHYGGHIERLMGTSANEWLQLPGKTFSSPKQRKGYDSDKNAAMTLREFERHFVEFIVNVYHQRAHGGLQHSPPVVAWERSLLGSDTQPGIGLPELPADPDKLRLDFLPFDTRTVQPYGILFNHLYYYHEVLSPWINAVDPHTKKKRMFRVRYDPRDISRLYFSDPDTNQYFPIPMANVAFGPISHWEVTTARRQLNAEGHESVDENRILESVKRSRERVEEAITKTKKARRDAHRQAQAMQVSKQAAYAAKASPESTPIASRPDDIFSLPITEFSETD